MISKKSLTVIDNAGNSIEYTCSQYPDRLVVFGSKKKEKEFILDSEENITLFSEEELIGFSYPIEFSMTKLSTEITLSKDEILMLMPIDSLIR